MSNSNHNRLGARNDSMAIMRLDLSSAIGEEHGASSEGHARRVDGTGRRAGVERDAGLARYAGVDGSGGSAGAKRRCGWLPAEREPSSVARRVAGARACEGGW